MEFIWTQVGNEFFRGVSGGERKRTNIGMELIIEPQVLFLDEPTTGLDAFTAVSVIKLLKGWVSFIPCSLVDFLDLHTNTCKVNQGNSITGVIPSPCRILDCGWWTTGVYTTQIQYLVACLASIPTIHKWVHDYFPGYCSKLHKQTTGNESCSKTTVNFNKAHHRINRTSIQATLTVAAASPGYTLFTHFCAAHHSTSFLEKK